MNYWPLLGIAFVVVGFVLRLNPALVVVGAGVATGLLAGKTPLMVLELIGEAFTKQRYLALFLLTLPAIGLLERHGLKERAQSWIAKLRGVTAGRALTAYLGGRQLLSALGLRDRHNPRRVTTALFWALLGAMFLAAEHLPAAAVGVVVVVLACLAGFGGLGRGHYEESSVEARQSEAARLGNRLFWPALLIPGVCVLFAVVLKDAAIGGVRLLGAEQTTLVALGIACVVAAVAACRLTRQSPWSAVEQSRRLIDAVGWAAILPLLLATLGGVFAASGVGDAVAELVRMAIPVDNRLVVVVAYAVGMALFTMVMGNAFAAFPVMTAGIGLPLLVQLHGADAASLTAIGMLSGYCGTLLTPMAANFNLVPAALLELKDPNAVIRQQVATALPLLACNIALMYAIVFR